MVIHVFLRFLTSLKKVKGENHALTRIIAQTL